MIVTPGLKLDNTQLAQSIDKLFHYLAVYVRQETTVKVRDGSGSIVYRKVFYPPREVSISPTLFTRLDGCHGAGNCCRVPFDLVYTDYDRQRIVDFDAKAAYETFEAESVARFLLTREVLLSRLVEYEVEFRLGSEPGWHGWRAALWVQENKEVFNLSGKKSCPYLFVGDDRYFCGAHPFKPLHCWYPHMTVRVSSKTNNVSIGRMQYGRNHKFGCPALFREPAEEGILFENEVETYFDNQYQADYEKLRWTASSIASLNFEDRHNDGMVLPRRFANMRPEIAAAITAKKNISVTLFNR